MFSLFFMIQKFQRRQEEKADTLGSLFAELTQIDFSGAFNKINHSLVGEILSSGGFQSLMSSSPNDSSSTMSFAVLTHNATYSKMTEAALICFLLPFLSCDLFQPYGFKSSFRVNRLKSES